MVVGVDSVVSLRAVDDVRPSVLSFELRRLSAVALEGDDFSIGWTSQPSTSPSTAFVVSPRAFEIGVWCSSFGGSSGGGVGVCGWKGDVVGVRDGVIGMTYGGAVAGPRWKNAFFPSAPCGSPAGNRGLRAVRST